MTRSSTEKTFDIAACRVHLQARQQRRHQAREQQQQAVLQALLEAIAAGCITVAQPLPAFGQLQAEGDESFCADFDQPDQAAEVN